MLITPYMAQIIFYVFAFFTVVTATMVVCSRNPLHSVLFLVATFVSTAILWMLIQAEFLSLVLIFVYVGAVMTLFLFVVMMLQVDLVHMREGFVRYLPFALLIMFAILAMLIYVFMPDNLPLHGLQIMPHAASYNNTAQLGKLLYTHYLLSFEIAGVILLTAIVASISLAFSGRKSGTKSQRIAKQIAANKSSRLTLVDDMNPNSSLGDNK
jgi:NADH-quinone oxidoreductase subunit J